MQHCMRLQSTLFLKKSFNVRDLINFTVRTKISDHKVNRVNLGARGISYTIKAKFESY